MLTTQDLKQIKIIVEEVVEEKLVEKIKFLPTTDVFLTKMAEVMGELKDMRENHELLSFRVSNHSDDIAALQNLHPNNRHAML